MQVGNNLNFWISTDLQGQHVSTSVLSLMMPEVSSCIRSSTKTTSTSQGETKGGLKYQNAPSSRQHHNSDTKVIRMMARRRWHQATSEADFAPAVPRQLARVAMVVGFSTYLSIYLSIYLSTR